MKQRLLFFALLISTSILHGQTPADALPALATLLIPAARPGLGPRLETGKDAMAPNAAAPKGGAILVFQGAGKLESMFGGLQRGKPYARMRSGAGWPHPFAA